MANPQVENGHTEIANELLEAIIKTPMSDYEHRIFWLIIRKTYGFKKKQDWISQTQIVQETGILRQHVSRTIKKLIDKNMIVKDNRHLSIQKDYEVWLLPKQVTNKSNLNGLQKEPKQVTKVTQIGSQSNLNRGIQKKLIQKKLIQKKYISATVIPFDEVIRLYNTTCLDLVKVKIMSKTREDNIRYRWNKFAVKKDKAGNEIGIKLFEELFTAANESNFLSGRVEDKRGFKTQWKADFDWLIKEENLIKVLEGKYDNN
jgi:phage replication O-like protein O